MFSLFGLCVVLSLEGRLGKVGRLSSAVLAGEVELSNVGWGDWSQGLKASTWKGRVRAAGLQRMAREAGRAV